MCLYLKQKDEKLKEPLGFPFENEFSTYSFGRRFPEKSINESHSGKGNPKA
jgi:hypothetical protein